MNIEHYKKTIVKQVTELLDQREDDIAKAWRENIEEAQSNEKNKPPMTITFASSIDIEADKISTKISFTAKYTSAISEPIPDPNQLKLPLEGGDE